MRTEQKIFNDLIETIVNNSKNNEAKITNVELWAKSWKEEMKQALTLTDVSHSMTGEGMNCLEFFHMIKKEWCVSEEQWKPFWNDVLTFARKYHKERKEYCG